MSDNHDTITALARLEEAERENQKLRSERLLAEHARDEAQREASAARDLAAIAQRARDDMARDLSAANKASAELATLRAQLASAEAELSAPITEESLRRRNGGALPVGNGCEIAVRGTTAQLAERDAEVARMRAIFPEVLRRLKSGACCPDCSLDFLAEIPNEVGLVVDALRARLAERDVATGSTRRVNVSKNTQEIDKCAP